MLTHIDIDRNLLKEALDLSGAKTMKALVNEALAEYVRVRKQRKILELFGEIDFDHSYNYKIDRGLR